MNKAYRPKMGLGDGKRVEVGAARWTLDDLLWSTDTGSTVLK